MLLVTALMISTALITGDCDSVDTKLAVTHTVQGGVGTTGTIGRPRLGWVQILAKHLLIKSRTITPAQCKESFIPVQQSHIVLPVHL